MQNNKEQLVANQFIWLLHNQKEDLISAFNNAGIDVDEDVDTLQLKQLLEREIAKYKDSKNEKSKKLIFNVSSLIASNGDMYSAFFGDEEIEEEDFGDDDDEEDEELEDMGFDTSKYGEEKKKGSFWKDVKLDKIIDFGNALIGAFTNNRVSDEDATRPPIGNDNQRRGVSTGKIIAISVTLLAVTGIGIFIYKMYSNKGK
tara:strand:- start:774 stop:1376 length:603 start_codon:yes stop_codon:yes gene_type:complete